MIKRRSKSIRLVFLFALMMFTVLVLTVLLTAICKGILSYFGIVDERRQWYLLGMLAVVGGTAVSILLSGIPLRPVRKFTDAIDRIAEGDYTVRVHFGGLKDLKMLSDKFNHMVEEIGSVEALRNDFISQVSHEFKTPIVSIRGFAKALKREDISEKEREEYLDIIILESERLASLSDRMLYLSKLESQTILVDKEHFNLSEQLRLVIILLYEKLMEKDLQIQFDCGEIFFTGNEEILKQVWINLLDNAIKFSPKGGLVKVDVTQDDSGTYVTFTNQGEPIDNDSAKRVFEKFYQVDSSHATKGNGLGLAIAERIVKLHNGTINLTQPRRGEITFMVCFGDLTEFKDYKGM